MLDKMTVGNRTYRVACLLSLAASLWPGSLGAQRALPLVRQQQRIRQRLLASPLLRFDSIGRPGRIQAIEALARREVGCKLTAVDLPLAAGRDKKTAVVGLYRSHAVGKHELTAVFKLVADEREFVDEQLAHHVLARAKLTHSKLYRILGVYRGADGTFGTLMSAAPETSLEAAMKLAGGRRGAARTKALELAHRDAESLADALAELHRAFPRRRQVPRGRKRAEIRDTRQKLSEALEGLAAAGRPLSKAQRRLIEVELKERAQTYLDRAIPASVVHGDFILDNVRIDGRGEVTLIDLESLPRSLDRSGRGAAAGGIDLAAVTVGIRSGLGAGVTPAELDALSRIFVDRYQQRTGLETPVLQAQLAYFTLHRAIKSLWKTIKRPPADQSPAEQKAKQRRVLERLLDEIRR